MDIEGHGIGQHPSVGHPPPALDGCGEASLDELGPLRIGPVVTEGQAARWDAILDEEHFLGSGPLAGKRLRYLIESAHFGPVAASLIWTPPTGVCVSG